jgi:hypothetical protein
MYVGAARRPWSRYASVEWLGEDLVKQYERCDKTKLRKPRTKRPAVKMEARVPGTEVRRYGGKAGAELLS